MLATIRAEIRNQAGKRYEHVFEPADFLGTSTGVEQRADELVAMGYSPSEAAALATSRQTREHKLCVIDSAMRAARSAKQKGTTRKRA